ncbi:glycoside hydrolase family 31, partial [mine drainage metagenome]
HTTVLLEPYAPNVIRVSISTLKSYALAPPGYGIIAKPDVAGWRYARSASGETYSSPRLSVTILGPARHHSPHLLGQRRINQFFTDNGAPHYANVRLRFKLPDGHTVVTLKKWFMSRPSYGAGDMDILHDRRPSDPPFYRVGAVFSAQHGEHYYGLGENQQGRLDHRDQSVRCWSDYWGGRR